MRNTMKYSSLLLLTGLLLLAAWPAMAQNDGGAPGAYLRFGTSARALGLGNAMVGAADDVAASYLNPAGLAQLRTMELTGMGASLYEDTRYSFFSLGMPTEKWGTFALSGTFVSSGGFERSSVFEDTDETFSETEGSFGLSYGRGNSRLAWGVTLKSVSQSVAGASGGGLGIDLGLYFRPHRNISFGASIQNAVAPEITLDQEGEKLARTVRGGTALRFFNNRLMVLTDLVKTEFMDPSFRSGLEMWPTKMMSLRGGYNAASEDFSAGAGFRLNNWQFDYTYINHDLGGMNVLSATLRFGVPFGVKMSQDRSLFSPSGSEREVEFQIETAVTGNVESWELEIKDSNDQVVRTLSGNGTPPESVTWRGEDENGRLVDDGHYKAYVTILDDLGQIWDHESSVSVLGFRDRTRTPIRVEISGDAMSGKEGKER